MEDLLNQARQKMRKAVEHLLEELISIRSGRATPSLLEGIKVNAYGSQMLLKELAGINVPEPRLLIVQPWDQNNLDIIVKAIRESGMGFNPVSEANVIRVAVPPLTQERRDDLIKVVGNKAEETRVAIRSVRRETIEQVDKNEKSGQLSKDEAKRYSESVQKITDEMIGEVDRIAKNKEEELKEV